MTKRFKNPYFWVGIIGVILAAMGIDGSTLTSWAAVGNAVTALVRNPYMIASVFMAVLGVFVDPSTSGIADHNKVSEMTVEEAEGAIRRNPDLLNDTEGDEA